MPAVLVALLGLLTPVVSPATQVTPRPELVRVYVAPLPPPASGFVDADSKRLADSHADLLGRLKKKKALVLVSRPEQADVTLTLVTSREEATGATVTSTSPLTRGSTYTEQATLKTVRVHLNAGDYEREFVGQWASWSAAAYDAAQQIEVWAKDNRDLIIAKRSAPAPR